MFNRRVEKYQDIIRLYKIPLVLFAGSVASVFISIILLYRSTFSTSAIEFSVGESTASAAVMRRTITVDVGGGVVHPGVYELAEGSRIGEAIQAAGGLSGSADMQLLEKGVNRAQRVADGAKVYIPIQKDIQNSIREEVISSNTSHNNEIQELGSEVFSINEAEAAQLESLPGIGPVTAQKIVDGRPYMSLEELVQKKVIGKKTFEAIRSHISL